MLRRSIRCAHAVVLVGWATIPWDAAPAAAQATAQLPLQFDFLNPGARSLALGGAFIGAADDATTAFANPAGLAALARLEISGEVRYRRLETPFLLGGRVSGTITGIAPDTVQGPIYSTDVDEHVSPAFFSFVLPLPRVTLAAYVHELVRIDNTFFSEGAFQRAVFSGVPTDRVRELPIGGSREVTIRNYGGAAGVRLHDRLSVGGGISLYTFDLRARFARYTFESDIYSAPDTDIVTATADQDGDDIGFGVNVGALWTVAPPVRIGVSFRRGPRFDFTQHDVVRLNQVDLLRAGTFKVPDVFGVGLEWRLSQSLRVLADYDRVQYAQLEQDFIEIQALASGRPDQLNVDNGNEVHAGVEYQFLQAPKPFALRAGAWLDPDHSVRYVPTPALDRLDLLYQATLPGGDDVVHYTFGGGIVLSPHIEVNAGADFSSRTTYVTASAVVRF